MTFASSLVLLIRASPPGRAGWFGLVRDARLAIHLCYGDRAKEVQPRWMFVLRDLFGVPFSEIGPIVGRTPDAAKMLASRARRRVRSGSAEPDADRRRQREIVDAFLAAARAGDFNALVEVLDPDVVLRADMGAAAPADLTPVVVGAAAVAGRTLLFSQPGASSEHALVNGAAGVVTRRNGKMVAVLGFTIAHGKIVAIDVLADPERLRRLDSAERAVPPSDLSLLGLVRHMTKVERAWFRQRFAGEQVDSPFEDDKTAEFTRTDPTRPGPRPTMPG